MTEQIKAAIIDDEAKNINILKKILAAYCPEVSIVGEARDARHAVELINSRKPSLLFLDIEMPYGNAFDVLEQIYELRFEVIFITAFNEYAIKAFKYNALDYLLKPIHIDDLVAAVRKAREFINLRNSNEQMKSLLLSMRMQQEPEGKIPLYAKDEIIIVSIPDIVRCEASGRYTYFYLKSKRKIITSKNIGEYESILPDKLFFRVHHSHIINLREIKTYHRGRGGSIEMTDGTIIDVAVRRKEDFLGRLGQLKK